MKLLVVSLTLLIVSRITVAQESIKWDSTSKLKWDDFLGKTNEMDSWSALTSTEIYFRIQIESSRYSDTVFAVFHKNSSWVRHKSDNLLAHEQGHFDITEIFARMLRKKIKEFVPNSNDLKYNLLLLYYEVENARKQMESQYDIETNHSINHEKQLLWNLKIANELKALEAFSK